MDFVDAHRDTYGVESICKVLQIAPSGYRRHAACQRHPELRCARAERDDTLMAHIQRVWQANLRVAVDATAHIIVAAEVVNTSSDVQQLPMVLKVVKEHSGASPASVLADAGYRSEAVMAELT